uniref:Uncharacterized protein n=1 Tax=Nelumbo nucifera TaxID=4432 RepID=A0A822ZKE4_NELNU|nr:TPA_asm: hypothetical protein HUJ06_000438 [Nelumbo nucifera]
MFRIVKAVEREPASCGSITDDMGELRRIKREQASGNKIENVGAQMNDSVRNPSEQVADAEALLDIASILVTSVKSSCNGVTPADFVTSLLKISTFPWAKTFEAD